MGGSTVPSLFLIDWVFAPVLTCRLWLALDVSIWPAHASAGPFMNAPIMLPPSSPPSWPSLPAGSESDVSDEPTSAEGHSLRALKASRRSISKTRARVSAACLPVCLWMYVPASLPLPVPALVRAIKASRRSISKTRARVRDHSVCLCMGRCFVPGPGPL